MEESGSTAAPAAAAAPPLETTPAQPAAVATDAAAISFSSIEYNLEVSQTIHNIYTIILLLLFYQFFYIASADCFINSSYHIGNCIINHLLLSLLSLPLFLL